MTLAQPPRPPLVAHRYPQSSDSLKPYTLSRSDRDCAGSPFETELASPKAAPPRSPGGGPQRRGSPCLPQAHPGLPERPRRQRRVLPANCAAAARALPPPRRPRGSAAAWHLGRARPPHSGRPPLPRPGARGSGGTAGPRPRARGSLAAGQVSAGRGAARSAAGGPRAFPESPSVLTALSTAPLRPALQTSATQSGGAACPPQREISHSSVTSPSHMRSPIELSASGHQLPAILDMEPSIIYNSQDVEPTYMPRN
nr:nascent polypeptide-associated complex subunit alpha, muscle-specific form-like [Equus asinus]